METLGTADTEQALKHIIYNYNLAIDIAYDRQFKHTYQILRKCEQSLHRLYHLQKHHIESGWTKEHVAESMAKQHVCLWGRVNK